MKEIPLTQHKVAIVDDDAYEWLSQWGWSAHYSHNDVWYADRNEPKQEGGYVTVKMHREILGVTDPKVHVDHRNHDGLDNRRENLRSATNSQNMGNQRKQTTPSSSIYKGVSWGKQSKKWQAYITSAKKRRYLGQYLTEDEAARAYNRASIEAFGEYAELNDVPEGP